mmetsp:Transcript_17418/g.48095  ORF Transcript_17418/g.48095 Transcript_17418/m.48095 type:complete len:311 (-) Transcript_17418:422-1354(-)
MEHAGLVGEKRQVEPQNRLVRRDQFHRVEGRHLGRLGDHSHPLQGVQRVATHGQVRVEPKDDQSTRRTQLVEGVLQGRNAVGIRNDGIAVVGARGSDRVPHGRSIVPKLLLVDNHVASEGSRFFHLGGSAHHPYHRRQSQQLGHLHHHASHSTGRGMDQYRSVARCNHRDGVVGRWRLLVFPACRNKGKPSPEMQCIQRRQRHGGQRRGLSKGQALRHFSELTGRDQTPRRIGTEKRRPVYLVAYRKGWRRRARCASGGYHPFHHSRNVESGNDGIAHKPVGALVESPPDAAIGVVDGEGTYSQNDEEGH